MKLINGSWFEFQHHNKPEGKYWNPICRRFSKEQWQEKLREMASLGMEYVVLMHTSLVYEDYAESYFDSGIYDRPKDFGCADPIGAMLEEADRLGLKVFLSTGFYGVWNQNNKNMYDPEVLKRAFAASEKVFVLYGQHTSFYGWYFPEEALILSYFSDYFIDYVNRFSAFVHSLDQKYKTMIAPFGTCLVNADDKYVAQLERMDIDFIAYQDEVGVKKVKAKETAAIFEALKKVHDKAGRARLWADIEIFKFERYLYNSALLPAGIKRIKIQLENVTPYVDEVLCYQYFGIMNQPGSIAYCGHPDSIQFYEDYKALVEEMR